MRFGLRRQLFVIGLVTLALPVASALYIRETERALRDAQAAFLSDLGRGLVPLLTAPAALSPPGTGLMWPIRCGWLGCPGPMRST